MAGVLDRVPVLLHAVLEGELHAAHPDEVLQPLLVHRPGRRYGQHGRTEHRQLAPAPVPGAAPFFELAGLGPARGLGSAERSGCLTSRSRRQRPLPEVHRLHGGSARWQEGPAAVYRVYRVYREQA